MHADLGRDKVGFFYGLIWNRTLSRRIQSFSNSIPSDKLLATRHSERIKRKTRLALNLLIYRQEMARLEGESSNTFFEVLEEWEQHLTQLDLDGLGVCDDDQSNE